jgi:tripartite-type tricarboxylate transporter receptor subunit TctC
MLNRMVRQFLLALCLGGFAAATQAAGAYPDKPVRLLVPFPPGGATDTIVRLVATRLSEKWQQQIIVDNRPGAGTLIASDLAAKAPADGYTLLIVTAAFAVNPSLYGKMPYDTARDFAPITLISAAPNVLIINPQLPVGSVRELIDYAKAHPNAINFASAGNGTSNHIAGEMFKSMAGIDITHVPYKGDAPSITDLIGGQVQMLFIGLAPVADHVKSGRLKALAVATSKPSPLVPNLPTVASTVPGFESVVWNGLVAPARTPPAIVDKIQKDVAAVLGQQDTRDRILALGFEPQPDTPAQFAAYLKQQIDSSARVVREAGIKVE